MSKQYKNLGATLFFLLAVTLIFACSVTTSPPNTPGFDPTIAALQMQGTALSLHMTQAALQPPAQGTSTPEPGALGTPTETQPVYTPTATPRIIIQSDAIEITYGDKLSSYPRKSSGILYGFKGTKGDSVTILLESSNAHPNTPSCSLSSTSTTFSLQTPHIDLAATFESPHLSSLRDYVLQDLAAYYIMVTCTGSSCNGNCVQADLSLDNK